MKVEQQKAQQNQKIENSGNEDQKKEKVEFVKRQQEL